MSHSPTSLEKTGAAKYVPFLRQVAVTLAALWIPAIYPLAAYATEDFVVGAAAGCGIALLNALAGCVSIVWAFDRGQKDFLKVLFGGMGLRLMLMGLAFGLLLALTSIDRVGLTFSLLLFYVGFQALEIRFLLSHLKTGGGGSAGSQEEDAAPRPL